MLSYFAFPFTFASGLFLIWFWINLTSKKLYRGAFLHKAHTPAFIFVVVVFCVMDVIAILWIANIDQKIIYVIVTVILVFFLLIAVSYFVAACRVYVYSKTKGTAHRQMFRSITIKICLSGVVLVVICGLSFFTSSTDKVAVRAVIIHMTNFLFILRAFLVIDCFSTEKAEKSTSEISGSSSKNNTSDQLTTI